MGVMPYIAPELFNGGTYSKKSDVYAFGMLMWEISAEEKPFNNIPHNHSLALQICQGLQKCWNMDPTQRPSTKEMCDQIGDWDHEEKKEGIDKADEIRKLNSETKREEEKIQHPEA